MTPDAAWSDVAEWYDQRQEDTGDFWHRTLIDPVLVELVGDVRGKDVLDLACGNGYLARRFAAQGARVVAVDSSSRMIALACQRESTAPKGVRYHTADAARLSILDDGSMDLVYSNMAMMDIADADRACREVGRVLRTGGRFVASLSHPCFDTGSGSSWLVERTLRTTGYSRRITEYRDLRADSIPWGAVHGTRTPLFTTTGYHRPLSWYVGTLMRAGLLIRRLEEPRPTSEFRAEDPAGPAIEKVPLHLVWDAVKIPS